MPGAKGPPPRRKRLSAPYWMTARGPVRYCCSTGPTTPARTSVPVSVSTWSPVDRRRPSVVPTRRRTPGGGRWSRGGRPAVRRERLGDRRAGLPLPRTGPSSNRTGARPPRRRPRRRPRRPASSCGRIRSPRTCAARPPGPPRGWRAPRGGWSPCPQARVPKPVVRPQSLFAAAPDPRRWWDLAVIGGVFGAIAASGAQRHAEAPACLRGPPAPGTRGVSRRSSRSRRHPARTAFTPWRWPSGRSSALRGRPGRARPAGPPPRSRGRRCRWWSTGC